MCISNSTQLDVMLNGRVVDALASVVHRDKAYSTGKTICGKLKDNIHRYVAVHSALTISFLGRTLVHCSSLGMNTLLVYIGEGFLRVKSFQDQ